MKAAVLYGPGDLRITDFPKPEMTDDSVCIRVSYCGVCGTDFHKFQGQAGSRPVKYPVPLGHEISGIVEEVGRNVTGFSKGDRVTVDPNWSCGKCWYCLNGKRHLCSCSKGVVKGMAEYVCPPAENVYHIPDSLSLIDASLSEPLSCCIHGVDLLDMKMGQTVCIIGLGAIGQIMLQLVKKSSAGNIIVIETVEEKRQTALDLGATLFINPLTQDIARTLEENNIECLEKVLECGGVPKTAQTALEIAGKGATVVLFSVAGAGATVPLNLYDAFSKELVIKTSYINPSTMGRAVSLLAQGAIDTSRAISKVISLEELPQEIATRALSRYGKVVVRID